MNSNKILFVLACLAPLTFFACGQGPDCYLGNRGMMGYGYGGGFMWLIVIALIGVGIYFLIRNLKSKDTHSSVTETPLDILKKRYAKGEINKEEFDLKKIDLES